MNRSRFPVIFNQPEITIINNENHGLIQLTIKVVSHVISLLKALYTISLFSVPRFAAISSHSDY